MSREKQSELKKKGYEKVLKLSKKLQKHIERNLNIKHINYKIQYILHDPFTFVNAYTKISKNKGALTRGYNDDNIMEYFGLKQATKLARKKKMSMKKIFVKYGKKLDISITTKSIKAEIVRYTEFSDLTQLIYRRKNQIHKPITPMDSDPFRI